MRQYLELLVRVRTPLPENFDQLSIRDRVNIIESLRDREMGEVVEARVLGEVQLALSDG